MFEEKRKSVRRTVNQPGTVVFGAVRLSCIIDDLSDGGARLVVQGELPEVLTLVFNDDQPARRCRLVWRLDDEAGVEFIATPTDQP